MCGLWASLGIAPPSGILDVLAHRGPDDQGIERFETQAGPLALGHRRLAIIDLSETGHQPMPSADGRHWIVFNGEIYNYLELKSELEFLGHHFRGTGDTEVLLAAFVQWGRACLAKFTGMFAFVIYDTRDQKIFAARDPFGIKPLYYTQTPEGFAFASEIKALLPIESLSRQVNPQRVYDYLRWGQTDHGAHTMFAQIRQVPAGHFVDGNCETRRLPSPERYWQPSFNTDRSLSFADAAARLRELFLRSIELHLRSDVPVGTSLSGGIDSSSVFMAIAHLLEGEKLPQGFSYLAKGTAVDESRWVRIVQNESGAQIHEIETDPSLLAEDVENLIAIQDEPFGSTSILAQYCVFRRAQEVGVKVLLDGQGADELLSGYTAYLSTRLAALIKGGEIARAVHFLRAVASDKSEPLTALIMRTASELLPPHLENTARDLMGYGRVPHWLNGAWLDEQGCDVRGAGKGASSHGDLKARLMGALTATSLPALLRYEDRNSMAFSIESRVPFLTTEIADFVLSLPEDYLISKDGVTKSVFRAAMRGIVPQDILERKDKIGFATPERQLLQELKPWINDVLAGPTLDEIPCLDARAVRAEWENFCAGRGRFDFRFWRWTNLIKWVEQNNVVF